MKAGVLIGLAITLGFLVSPVFADPIMPYDELGHGFAGPGHIITDPGPGNQTNVLAYALAFGGGVQGDVIMLEPGSDSLRSDVIRFNGDNTLIFFSDNGLDGPDSPADTGFSSPLYPNRITISEVGSEANNGAFYTPAPGQPGFEPAAPNATFEFISDVTATPEPSSLLLLASGTGLLCFNRRRRLAAA
jgi:hypothetical protein